MPLSIPLTSTPLSVDPLPRTRGGELIARERHIGNIVDYVRDVGEGKFLVSGYSGVGKTSIVRHVIAELQQLAAAGVHIGGERRHVLVIEMAADQVEDPVIVGRQLLWRLRWEEEDGNVRLHDALSRRLREALEGASATSVERVQRSDRKVSPGIEFGGPVKVTLGGEASTGSERKAIYGPYDQQTTLLELSQVISRITSSSLLGGRRWLLRIRGEPDEQRRPLVIVVIDRVTSWDVLRRLGTLFAARHTVFLVVSPHELRATWQRRGDAGYEELQAFQDVYLECLWSAEVPQLLSKYVDYSRASSEARSLLPALAGFLTFGSAGIPRKCVSLLLRYRARGAEGMPMLRFEEGDVGTIEWWAGIYAILERRQAAILGEFIRNCTPPERDQYLRFLVTSARELLLRGNVTVSAASTSFTQLSDALRPPDEHDIRQRLVRVLQEEGVLTRSGDQYSLSSTSLMQAARAKDVFQTGVMPRFEEPSVGRPAPEPTSPPPSPGAPPPVSMPGDFTRVLEGLGESVTDRTNVALPSPPPPPPTRDAALEHLRAATASELTIEGLVGVGGMARVYVAREIALDRIVAVKVLSENLAADSLRSRFIREARTMASLSHPNIAPVYAVRETHGLVYFLMPLLRGGSLERLLRDRGPLSIETATAVAAQVGAALHYAHMRNVVHRDVKPANILFDEKGQANVVDFGIAGAVGAGDVGLTQTGVIIGTPRYMSPEQAQGGQTSPAMDQYAFGVLCYEMLAGRAPFEGESAPKLFVELLTKEPVHIMELRPDCPPDLAQGIMRMLAKTPQERFGSIEEAMIAMRIAQPSRPSLLNPRSPIANG